MGPGQDEDTCLALLACYHQSALKNGAAKNQLSGLMLVWSALREGIKAEGKPEPCCSPGGFLFQGAESHRRHCFHSDRRVRLHGSHPEGKGVAFSASFSQRRATAALGLSFTLLKKLIVGVEKEMSENY